MHSLPLYVRLTGRPVIFIGEAEAGDAKRRLLERAGARLVGPESDALLAFIALPDPEPIVAELKARGLLLNVADRPDLCDFTLPSIVDRDPVLVAIGTGGASAGLAAALRQRLETILPVNLGKIAGALSEARTSLRECFPGAADRRRAIAALLAEGGPLDPLGPIAEPITIAQCDAPQPPTQRIVITSPDPDDLTLRAARALGLADRVYHPADMAPAILVRARADAQRIIGPAPALPQPGLTVELAWQK